MRAPLDRPNIVLINCDDLGFGDLACTGHPLHATPHLDAMASAGTRFTDFYQASAVCSPSRGAMLTGCHPRRIGFDEFQGHGVLFPGQSVGLGSGEITFATALKAAGYATSHIGKWHCGDQPEFLPTRHGFDEYFGLPYSNDMGRQAGREKGEPLPLLLGEEVIEQQPDQASLTSRYTEHAVRYIRANASRPFLLYLAHMHVHLPLYVARRFLQESRNGAYGAAVACIDWSTGVIMSELRRLGIDRNTLVLFTSDNGSRCDFGPSNGGLRGTKGRSWEGGFRTPLLACMPGTVPAGRVCGEVVTGMDFLPTFASLAGAARAVAQPIDGVDRTAMLLGRPTQGESDVFPYYHRGHLDAIRVGRWKLFNSRHHWADRIEENLTELYDLESDPGEQIDVAAGHPDVVRSLRQHMDRVREELGDTNAATRAHGSGRRAIGSVPVGRPLTQFDPAHPYYMAMYDLNEIG